MLCSQCGAEGAAGNLFCGKCGGALDAERTVPVDPAGPSYRPRHEIVRREATILAAALLLIACVTFGVWYGLFYQRSPEMVVRRFIDADLQSQFARQNEYLIDRWDSRMVLSAFQAVRQHTGASPFKDYRITGTSQSGNTAYVNVELRFNLPSVPGVNTPLNAPAPPGPTFVPFSFVLTSEQGGWKIDGSQTLANASGALAAVGYTQIAPLLNGVPNITIPNLGLPGGVPLPMSPPTPSSSPSGATLL